MVICKDHVWQSVAIMMLLRINVSALKGKNAHFPNCREKQVNGDSATTTKLKLRCKVAIHSTGPFFSSLLLRTVSFFQSPSLALLFCFFFPVPPLLY